MSVIDYKLALGSHAIDGAADPVFNTVRTSNVIVSAAANGDAYVVDLDDAALVDTDDILLHFKTPADKFITIVGMEATMGINGNQTVVGRFELIEDPTVLDGSTADTPINLNRIVTTVSTTTIFSDSDTISGGLDLINHVFVGSDRGVPGSGGSAAPFLLKQSADYVIRVTNDSGVTVNAELNVAFIETT